MSVISVIPEPDFSAQKAGIRQIQSELAAEMSGVLIGALTTQYGPDEYRFEPGIGQIHYTAETAYKIGKDLGASLATALGNVYPNPPTLKPDPNDYWFMGELYPEADFETEPVNVATMDYYRRFLKLLHEREFKFVNSVAYEILDFFHPEAWKQRNFLGNPGLSGWYPPSAFIQPTNFDALNYISAVQAQILREAVALGMEPLFQIGEPWWWDGSYSTGEGKNAPCLYDPATMVLYEAETGNQVPTPYIKSIFDPVASNQWPYVDWLRKKLGDSTNYIRDRVKSLIPGSKATLLFFTPQIMSPASELTYRLNFPIAEWSYPNYDFVQIEDYDWIIAGDIELVPKTFDAATNLLNYPLSEVHYFIGFVLNAEDAYIWRTCDQALGLAIEAQIPYKYLWSYTQVMRDNIVMQRLRDCGC